MQDSVKPEVGLKAPRSKVVILLLKTTHKQFQKIKSKGNATTITLQNGKMDRSILLY